MDNKKNKNKLPQIKKDIKQFLTSEDGKMNKKDITKIAMSVLSLGIGLSGIAKPDDANAGCAHGNHASHSSY